MSARAWFSNGARMAWCDCGRTAYLVDAAEPAIGETCAWCGQQPDGTFLRCYASELPFVQDLARSIVGDMQPEPEVRPVIGLLDRREVNAHVWQREDLLRFYAPGSSHRFNLDGSDPKL